MGRSPALPGWGARERCLTWLNGWVGISQAAGIRCWGPGWRGSTESGPHVAGTETGLYGQSLDYKEGHKAGLPHNGEIMKDLYPRRRQNI